MVGILACCWRDLQRPILDADTVVVKDGKIAAIGREKDVDTEGATRLIDANGTTLAPGLIDNHASSGRFGLHGRTS